MKKVVLLLLCLSALVASRAQVAGMSTLPVLNIPFSARTAGVGFDYLSLDPDRCDPALAMGNPSLISETLSGQLALGFVNIFAGANFGSLAYAHTFKSIGTFTFGLQYGSYGRFDGYDEYDQPTGTFTAADYVMTIGWGRKIDDFVSIGVNCKPILSQYESYSAFALAFDLAATYLSSNKHFSATLMGRNIGTQISSFDGHSEPLRFKLSAVGSYQLQDAPFRLMLALNELQTWNLAYDDPLNPTSVTDPFTGQVTKQSDVARVLDNLGRHVSLGVELTIKGALYLQLGYSYRQMVEMKAADRFNTSGFSFGIGFEAKKFRLGYARNNYHLSQAPNYISLVLLL